ncbi:MAG: DoxX family protein [Candidatus Dormibacteraceae bacterium]
MSIAYVVVTILAAAWVGYSAAAVVFRAKWVTQALTEYGVPDSWRPWLATAKTAGAAGLLAGLFVPVIGIAAAIGLLVYFAGALVTVLRARYFSHIPYPLLFLAPVVASLVLHFAA